MSRQDHDSPSPSASPSPQSVASAAGGAADLAEAGWAEFQRLEQEWESGHDFDPFRARIAEVVAKREADIARRKRPVTGLSEFPNLTEALPEREKLSRLPTMFEARSVCLCIFCKSACFGSVSGIIPRSICV